MFSPGQYLSTSDITRQGASESSRVELIPITPKLISMDRATFKRETVPAASDIAAFTLDELKQGVVQGLSSGPIDIVMVGDVTVDDAIKAVASTFAALPARTPPAPHPSPAPP